VVVDLGQTGRIVGKPPIEKAPAAEPGHREASGGIRPSGIARLIRTSTRVSPYANRAREGSVLAL
jgi:hypothetical protein